MRSILPLGLVIDSVLGTIRVGDDANLVESGQASNLEPKAHIHLNLVPRDVGPPRITWMCMPMLVSTRVCEVVINYSLHAPERREVGVYGH